jgi:copper(I)-binding protein
MSHTGCGSLKGMRRSASMMSARFAPTRRVRGRSLLAAATALAGAAALAGCGAGQSSETTHVVSTINGVNGAVGNILIRNAYVAGPGIRGASLPLYTSLFNTSPVAERLMSATTPAATSVEVASGRAGSSAAVLVPPNNGIIMQPGTGSLKLVGLTGKLPVGNTILLTLTFARSGQVTLAVPVVAATEVVKNSAS